MTDFGNQKQIGKRNMLSPSLLSDLGKLPPQAIEFEEAVIGALMLERDALLTVIGFLSPDVFYKDEHKEIYEAILDLFRESKPIDVLTVTNKLRSKEKLEFIGGAFYISELTNRIGSAANIEYHARLVLEKYIARQMITLSSDMARLAYDEAEDVFKTLEFAQKGVYDITEMKRSREIKSAMDMVLAVADHVNRIKRETDPTKQLVSIKTGFSKLDEVLGGIQGGDLVIIAARPGMGKTAFVLSMIRNFSVLFGIKTAMFSLEMTYLQLGFRLVAMEMKVSAIDLRKGDISQETELAIIPGTSKLEFAPLFVDDTPGLTDMEFRAEARRLKIKLGIQAIVVDYLQLMESMKNNKNREQEISGITRTLKATAKELNIPVIALSQLSRTVEQRGGDKRPKLGDLRESGSIEQDADQVIFIYRPEYYGLNIDTEQMPLADGYTELIVAKNRHGDVSHAVVKFLKEQASFTEMEDVNNTMGQGKQEDLPFDMATDEDAPF